MSADSTTQSVLFPKLFPGKQVVAKFDQEHGSSDGGALLLKAVDEQLGLSERLAACLGDRRQPGKIRHEIEELLRQRTFGIACGYADANDAARIADDPMHKLLAGRDPIAGEPLASQPTLSRFENRVRRGAIDGKTVKNLVQPDVSAEPRRLARVPYALACAVLGLALGWLPKLLHGPIPEKFDVYYLKGSVMVWAFYTARMLIGLWVGVGTWPARWFLRGPLYGFLTLLPVSFIALATPNCDAT